MLSETLEYYNQIGQGKSLIGVCFGNGCRIIGFSHRTNDKCKRAFWKMLCGQCNQEYIIRQDLIKTNKTCKLCSYFNLQKEFVGNTFGNNGVVLKRGNKINNRYTWQVLCGQCNKVFLVKYNKLKTQKTCITCQRINHRKEDLTKKRIRNWKVIKRSKIKPGSASTYYWCKCNCGNLSIVDRSILLFANTSYCKKCYIGKNNKQWNKNLTEQERKNRRLVPGYLDLIKAVYKRDNYKCVLCSSNKKICCHHLDSYGQFPDKRLDSHNCVCLCQKHHVKFHSLYGPNCFQWQFEQFILLGEYLC